ncbi:MAG: DNA cytosine methyltransferase [Deltaproteobacteria bacterium]|jgi:DNA (cytosine-5)-methyltransferase 1|nr:DNA cytosine methyltransferase [Deltaproteobacteria bacterium]
MKVFRLGELFCGPGGLARGALDARAAGNACEIRHGWATDNDPDACATYALNICGGDSSTVVCEDVRKLDFARLERLAGVDCLAFGFPCNDFSLVGEKKGTGGDYGGLYAYGVKALRRFRPEWFVAENVAGIRNTDSGRGFARILGEMAAAGYRLTPHQYRFDEYGVPQARRRVIIVGVRADLHAVFRVPSPELRRLPDNSARSALEDPPIPPGAANSEPTRHDPEVVRRLRRIRPGENAFNSDLPPSLSLNVKGARISQIYRRLDPDRPSYTVTGSGGGGTHIYHWSEPRALTNRERARLQTFPDDFVFKGAKGSVRRQIGMAVPCEGARIIFEAVLNSFAGIVYKSVDSNIPFPEARSLPTAAHRLFPA